MEPYRAREYLTKPELEQLITAARKGRNPEPNRSLIMMTFRWIIRNSAACPCARSALIQSSSPICQIGANSGAGIRSQGPCIWLAADYCCFAF